MFQSLKEILVLFNCSCIFSFNSKYLYTIYTVYNDSLNYCWKARVFDAAACLLTGNLNIVVQCSKFSIETGIFNKNEPKIPHSDYTAYMPHLELKLKRKNMHHTHFFHTRNCTSKGRWVGWFILMQLVLRKTERFGSFWFLLWDLFTKTWLTSFKPFQPNNGFKPLV